MTEQSFSKFEVLFEGIPIPFSSLTINESESNFPSATITVAATPRITKILPKTKVVIFGPDIEDTDKQILLYEGEVVGISYQVSAEGSRMASFSTVSLLSEWQKVRTRPHDSFSSSEYSKASGEATVNRYNTTQGKKGTTPVSVEIFRALTEAVAEKQEPEVFGELQKALSSQQLTQVANFVDEFIKLLGDKSVENGNVGKFIEFFLRKFETNNPFYGIESLSFGITDSILTLPNVGNFGPYRSRAIKNNFLAFAQSIKNPFQNGGLKLIGAIVEFLQMCKYTMNVIASPTASTHFWAKNNTKGGPIRAHFLPDLASAPPIKANIFFPNQVNQFSYNRSFQMEPTRTVGKLSYNFFENVQGIEELVPFAVEPKNLQINQQAVESNSINFTTEESYKGIVPNFQEFDALFAQVDVQEESDTAPQASKEEVLNKVSEPLNALTESSHYETKLKSRGASLSATYNPYRIIGMPGAYIDAGDGPSMTGVINSIQTTVSSQGQVTTNIGFRACRLVEDIREDLQEGYITDDLINEFTDDPYIDVNPYLYAPKMYSFLEIGKQVYPLLQRGVLGKDSALQTAIEDGYAFEGALSNLQAATSNIEELDYSILGILERDSKGNLISYIPTTLQQVQDVPDFRESASYTKFMYESIYAYKDLYNSLPKDTKAINNLVIDTNYRPLMTREAYFEYIGAYSITGLPPDSSYKDSMNLLSSPDSIGHARTVISTTSKAISEPETVGSLTADSRRLKTKIKSIEDNLKYYDEAIEYLKGSTNTLNPAQRDTVDVTANAYRELKKEPIDTLEEQKESARKELIKASEELSEVLTKLDNPENIGKAYNSPSDFATEVFKPYNLTRKEHVVYAFARANKKYANGTFNLGIIK